MNKISCKYKFALVGNDPYAPIVLERLLELKFSPQFIISSDLKSEVAKIATEDRILVKKFYPKSWPSLAQDIKKLDFLLVVNFGYIIPKSIYELPVFETFNIHPSLLPKNRGASPVVNEILSGDLQGGVTIYKLDEKMDHGPILAAKPCRENNESIASIYIKRFQIGTKLFVEVIEKYIRGDIKLTKQDHSKATYSKRLNKKDGLLSLGKKYNPEEIILRIRAFTPWPGVFFFWKKGKKEYKIQILEAKKIKIVGKRIPKGQYLFHIDNKLYLDIKTDGHYLEIVRLKISGKNEILAKDFINGYLR